MGGCQPEDGDRPPDTSFTQIDPGGRRKQFSMKLSTMLTFAITLLLLSPAHVAAQARERVQFRISEEVSVGTTVGRVPTRPGFTYRLNSDEAVFSLDPVTGELSTRARLDREDTPGGQFDLIVLSSSPTYPIEVVITVDDVNDHAPRFPQPVTQISFSEGSTPGSRVLLDSAEDRDQGDNGRVRDYTILSGNEAGRFKLSVSTNPDSQAAYLHLETREALDREERSSYLLNISASDRGIPALTGYMQLTINILDINDNAPEFTESEYRARINESVATGSFVTQVAARDRDTGDNARVSYYLAGDQAGDTDTDQFNIDEETGVLTTNQPLACRDNLCHVRLVARDHGSPRQDVRTSLKVELIDANDHDPQILFRYFPDQTAKFATVEENAKPGNLVSAITVTDKDKGDNGKTSVQIVAGNSQGHFRLDSRGGIHIVRVDSELDRETVRLYNLTVVAEDKGVPPRTSTAFLIIHVNDINDHSPVFSEDTYTAVLTESAAIGSFVASPLALDEDTGVNSNIYYSILEGKFSQNENNRNDLQWFDIHHNSGLITTRMQIDREKQAEVNLKISARDGGTNPKFATAQVKITIEDENDESPRFLQGTAGLLILEISENTRVGSKITSVQAVDNDQGRNGSVSYSLSRATQARYPGVFSINSGSGDITVNTVMDRETRAKYDLVVIAEDGGEPARSSSLSVHIDVGDTNDNSPSFYPLRYFVVLQSDFSQEEACVQLRATDADEGINAVVEYELIEGDTSTFSLNDQNGKIFLRKPVRDISGNIYDLKVAAKDKKGRKSVEHADVEIIVESDSLKYLSCTENLYRFSISEDSSISSPDIGRIVGNVKLQDNSLTGLQFEIIDGNEFDTFSIEESSGTIITKRPLDRETQEKTVLKIRVKSTSAVISVICQAEVKLVDVNDQTPVITDDEVITISEDAPIKEIIKIVKARDDDKGKNARVHYKLADDIDGHFSINQDTGAIHLEKPLKKSQSKLDKVFLNVFVSDNGVPSLSSNYTYRLEVTDVNDHSPLFDLEEFDLSLPENVPVNSKIFWLKATDEDSGENARVEYKILSGDNHTFGIFPDGNLYLKMEVDREERDYYSLGVSASDHGDPSRSSTATMTIHITDKNDNHPHFTSGTYNFFINENEPRSTYVGQIYATDRDIGRNAELTYSEEKSQRYFSVDPKTGFIVSKAALDRELLISELGSDSVTFEVMVEDNGLPKLSDTATITVTILDENDNTPTFSKDTYVARVSESATVGTEVKTVFASDLDSGVNGEVSYSIVSGNRQRMFSINSTTGLISLARPLDREAVADFVLAVEARDGGDVSMRSAASVIIIVSDENDNAPRITNSALVLSLPEDAPVGQKVFTFNAQDGDEGENAELRFSISGGSYQKHFNIDQYTGALNLQKSLDYEKDRSFSLQITVTDRGSPALNDTATLRVHVTDVNDNAPQFPSTAIVRQIQEGLAPNSPVVTMTALDADTGDNGKVEFSLAGYETGSAEKFAIDPKTGVISTVGDIDREEVDTFRFTVVATDQAPAPGSRMSAEKVITIIVEDINDNSPEFVSVPTGTITPATQPGDVIVTIQASDRDSNSNGLVTYKFNQDSYVFSIDHYSGEISLKNKVDTLDPVYELVVVASDEAVQSERRSSSTTVTILGLTSEQPGPPFTQSEYSADIVESDPPGTFIATVELAENTPGPRFYISDVRSDSGRSSNIFRIDQDTGDIRTVAELDREMSGSEFVIQVLAVLDNGGRGAETRTSSCQVKVHMEDINDTPPVFQDISTVRFSEETNPGVALYTVRAYDADLDSVLSYSLVGGDTDTFIMDQETGEISLSHTVDREVRETYRLTVRASDGKHESVANLILVVQDSNDNIPNFSSQTFSFDVYESAGKGSQVGKVTAVDGDKGDNAEITYDLISDWGHEVFSLNPSTGIFTLTSDLDYEKEEHYRFVVSGTDSGQPRLSSTVTVYINVKDVNDNIPSFTQPLYKADIPEDAPPGSSIMQVEATDLDSENNGDIEYTIIGEAEQYFGVSNNGTMFSKQALDRETKATFSFIVKATDGGSQGGRHSATASVLLTLTDVNDQVPRFTSPSEGHISENQPPNTIVMSVTTEDEDEADNADVEYFLSQSDSENFVIGRLDGIIRTTRTLDREKKAEYRVTVTAQDHGLPALSATTNIKILVTDENDNTPEFRPKVYSTTVLENATIGQNILHTTAFDMDQGFNGDIRYTIVSGDKTTDFSIGEYSGVIKVNKKLDFERKNAYQLTIQAEDSGAPVRYDTASVSIYIEDINDSPPIFFHSPYTAYVVENGEELPRYVTSLRARDADSPPHNVVEYSIKKPVGNTFSINKTTGDVFLHSALDRETDPYYKLEVVAKDIGNPRLSSTGTLSVLVEDENDNAPVFGQAQYSLSLLENSEPGTLLARLTATDGDIGINGEIRYSLKGEDAEAFNIDENTGDLTSRRSLDREQKEAYEFIAVAEDNGNDIKLSNSARVIVRISDVNDNKPVLTNLVSNIIIPDTIRAGDFVFKFDAEDTDSDLNSRLQFSVRDSSGARPDFSVDASSGVMRASRSMDRPGQRFSLELEVSDTGNPSQSIRAAVTIQVESSSKFPVFASSANQIFIEEGSITADMPSVEATTVSGQAVQYKIAGGNLNKAFTIDSESGKLKLVKPLDREQLETFDLYIGAFILGSEGQVSYHKITVAVSDINDSEPVFQSDYIMAEVSEEQFPPVTITRVTASDADAGENGIVKYRLLDNTEKFGIDPQSGEIRTNVKLDREDQDEYELHVEAYDGGQRSLSGSAVIKVIVTDINDNPPKFTRIISINITENSSIGTKVVTVETVDPDIGENANATYELIENPGDKFRINPVTGDIIVSGDLDRELQDEYLLKVKATDGAWRADTTVGVNILDENDNQPTFPQDTVTLMFPHTTAAVALVGRVTASDKDGPGPNSAVKYKLRETSEYFSIDSSSGEIISKRKLSYINTTRSQSIENVYMLSVIATDHGKPPMSDECLVKILVTDTNTAPPVFTQVDYVRAIPSFAPAGMEVVLVEAVDLVDTGLNAEVTYSLRPSAYSQLFTIDSVSGSVKLGQDLQVSGSTSYRLEVLASDKGDPVMSSSTSVTLMPSADNLHSPKFSDVSTQVIIPENEPVDTFIIKLSASDRDTGINGMLRYSIVAGNEEERFKINDRSGQIFINKALDYDNENEYNLTIQAQDLAFEPKSSVSVLRIILTDVNDNVPFFERPQYDAYLRENSAPGTEIITMKAIDFDSPRYAKIQYQIEEQTMRQYFSVDKNSGKVTSKVLFDYEKYPEYSFHIVASNPGSSESNKTRLNVHITGANEFFPRFQQPVFQFSVSESALADTTVGQIRALDQDKGRDGEVFYFLIGNSNDKGFRLDKRTGVISVQKSLDREYQNRFVLTVLAKNRGSILGNDTDEAQVTITVQDGNDPPVFSQDNYRTSVRENIAIGSTILTVEAVDKDVRPRNSQFSYSIIEGNSEAMFEVDPSSGSIRTVRGLDREAEAGHQLVVAATDNGTPAATGTAVVSITVEDVNDNPPYLEPVARSASLRENSPANTLVARLLPTDRDLAPNTGPFRFYISAESEDGDKFSVDERTGELRSRVSVDREETPTLNIVLEIHDSGSPSLSANYDFTINVEDENDNPSQPRVLTVVVQTLNGDFTGGKIAPVKPKDPDTSGDYACEIKRGPTNIFQMRPNCDLTSGRLMNVAGYNLTVEGSDGIHDPVTSQVYITFDNFEHAAVEEAFIIRAVDTNVNSLPELFKQINFHTSQQGDSLQILSVKASDNFTDFYVAARSSRGSYVERTEAVTSLSRELTSRVARLSVGYSVCQESPCQNGGECSAVMAVRQDTAILEAGDIILNSPVFQEDWSCRCQDNFEGDTCQLKSNPCENPNPCQADGECIQEGYNFRCLCPPHRHGERCEIERSNSCDRNPCQNGGTCRESNLGDFFCLCRPGFQGAVCQTALDPCQPNPCQNGGECLSKKPNYQCKCPDNFYGTNCEKSTFGFGELSYMTFPSLDPNTNDVTITFSTTKPDCLLVYNYGEVSGGRSDFIAVELVQGRATFSFGGARTAITRISVSKYLSNGRWFKVTATRNNRVASLSVEDCTESGEYCKQCLAGDESCFTKDIGDTGTLSFNNNPMYFGGIDRVKPIIVRSDQVKSDDFVGCVKSLSVNGQPLNLKSSFLSSSGILSSCPIAGGLCDHHDCGQGQCTEVNWRPVCVCPGGVMAGDCDRSISPIALTQNATVTFKMSEKLRRIQLLANRANSAVSQDIRDNELGFTFRTENDEGLVFSAGTSNDYTKVMVGNKRLVYETRKSGHPRINITSETEVTDGQWHVLVIKQTSNILQVYLDDIKLDQDLETASTHDLLDPYLSQLQFGGRQYGPASAFRGCLVNFTINNEVQSWFGGSSLLPNVSFSGEVLDDCEPNFLSATAGSDPVNVGVVIVVVFFIILIFAILGSFFWYRMKKKKYEKMQNRSANESHGPSSYGLQTKSYDDTNRINRQKKMTPTHQKPDVIERDIVNDSPIGDYSRHELPDYSASMVMQDPEAPEHYDLENASSIAPSDIDVIYHYKGYRDHSRPGPGPIRLNSLAANNRLQSTPLARLSPSSEMSHQTPRILTLQDISGKQPLQSALLQTQQGRHSSRSLRTPLSHLTDSSGSDLNSSARARRHQHRRQKKKPGGVSSSEELDRMNRNSSLVNTMDGVSVTSSGRKSKAKFNDLLETNTELLHDDNSSSDSPSENDSFTCSEYDYEAPFEGGNKGLDHSQAGPAAAGGMVFRKLNSLSDNERLRNEGGRGSLTTLTVSDDDLSLSGFNTTNGPASWESLLNWSPNFNTFVGVFKDIAELPDLDSDERPNPLGDREDEEYI